jgi:hypothetical protein
MLSACKKNVKRFILKISVVNDIALRKKTITNSHHRIFRILWRRNKCWREIGKTFFIRTFSLSYLISEIPWRSVIYVVLDISSFKCIERGRSKHNIIKKLTILKGHHCDVLESLISATKVHFYITLKNSFFRFSDNAHSDSKRTSCRFYSYNCSFHFKTDSTIFKKSFDASIPLYFFIVFRLAQILRHWDQQ